MKLHLFTSVLLKDCGHNAKSIHKSNLPNESKYKYFSVKTLRITGRIQNSMCIAELCAPVHSSTNSAKHLATCHPCVLQKNPEHVTLIPSWTVELIQFTVWNIFWLFYLTAAHNSYHGLYSKPSNSFQEFQSFPTLKFPKSVILIS